MYGFLKSRLIFARLLMLSAALLLILIGIAAIYSVANPADISPAGVKNVGQLAPFWKKQAFFACLGIACFISVNAVNYRRLGDLSFWFYSLALVLLVVLLVGKFVGLAFVPEINGSYRWIQLEIGGFTLPAMQPSEFCKLAYILALSWYLRYRSNYRSFRVLIGPFVLTLLPMVLILPEPDLGTVLIMMPILFTMLFVAGAKGKHLLIIILLAVLISPLLWYKMRPYQQTRISSVLLQNGWVQKQAAAHPWLGRLLVGEKFTPERWMQAGGYQLIRSKFAVASGGFSGYGFRQGPFIKYNFFLPESHNDFIFAIIAHQWGFLGSAGVLILYVIIIICGLEIAAGNTDPFGKLLAVGIVGIFAVEVVVNIGMTLGLMPITGLTLPLVSYGGSSLVVSMALLGILNNVGRCRPFTAAYKR